jgi:hypothetical protein
MGISGGMTAVVVIAMMNLNWCSAPGGVVKIRSFGRATLWSVNFSL